MREWIPISTSPKARLVLAAIRMFGSQPYDSVTVSELAAAADVTTGTLYHHFASKIGLYAFVRADVERRLLDRMEGALGLGSNSPDMAPMRTALLVGFDFAVRENFAYLLGTSPPDDVVDELEQLLVKASSSPSVGRIMAAAWRAALRSATEDGAAADARGALASLLG